MVESVIGVSFPFHETAHDEHSSRTRGIVGSLHDTNLVLYRSQVAKQVGSNPSIGRNFKQVFRAHYSIPFFQSKIRVFFDKIQDFFKDELLFPKNIPFERIRK